MVLRTDRALTKEIAIHAMYWVIYVLFFTLVWGMYDYEFLRNLIIQLSSLPARALLVYTAIYLLFPRLILGGKYVQFLVSYFLLTLAVTLFVQRPVIYFLIEPDFLPNLNDVGFFSITAIMNTMLDLNTAALIPLGYVFVRQRQQENLPEENNQAAVEENRFVFLKVNKSIERVDTREILYIEGQKNYIKIITEPREIVTYKSLTAIQEELPGDSFIRVHRSFIINTDHIVSYSPSKIGLKNSVTNSRWEEIQG